jgi:hypothetical protein
VQAASSAVPAAEQAFAKQKTGITTALSAHQELISQRRAFLNAVRAYNAEIVEYASYVAGPTTSTATLVSMLTRSKPNKQSASGGSTNPFGAIAEPTLAPPTRDPAVQPAGGDLIIRDENWRGVDDFGGGLNAPFAPGQAAQPETKLQEIAPAQKD